MITKTTSTGPSTYVEKPVSYTDSGYIDELVSNGDSTDVVIAHLRNIIVELDDRIECLENIINGIYRHVEAANATL